MNRPPVYAPTAGLPALGTVRPDGWCPTCKANTRHTAEVLVLTPGGVTVAGTAVWCEVHDDPDDGGPRCG